MNFGEHAQPFLFAHAACNRKLLFGNFALEFLGQIMCFFISVGGAALVILPTIHIGRVKVGTHQICPLSDLLGKNCSVWVCYAKVYVIKRDP